VTAPKANRGDRLQDQYEIDALAERVLCSPIMADRRAGELAALSFEIAEAFIAERNRRRAAIAGGAS